MFLACSKLFEHKLSAVHTFMWKPAHTHFAHATHVFLTMDKLVSIITA